jgi:hypothetical protein
MTSDLPARDGAPVERERHDVGAQSFRRTRSVGDRAVTVRVFAPGPKPAVVRVSAAFDFFVEAIREWSWRRVSFRESVVSDAPHCAVLHAIRA